MDKRVRKGAATATGSSSPAHSSRLCLRQHQHRQQQRASHPTIPARRQTDPWSGEGRAKHASPAGSTRSAVPRVRRAWPARSEESLVSTEQMVDGGVAAPSQDLGAQPGRLQSRYSHRWPRARPALKTHQMHHQHQPLQRQAASSRQQYRHPLFKCQHCCPLTSRCLWNFTLLMSTPYPHTPSSTLKPPSVIPSTASWKPACRMPSRLSPATIMAPHSEGGRPTFLGFTPPRT